MSHRHPTAEEVFLKEATREILRDPAKLDHYLEKAAALQLPNLGAISLSLARLADGGASRPTPR